MDFQTVEQNVELLIEDILYVHRNWITKLYLDDKKTDSEILDLLSTRHLPVTITQIRRCLAQWNLISSPPASRRGSASSSLTSHSSFCWEGAELPRSPSPASSTTSYYSMSPDNIDLYSKRPLPLLPKKSIIITQSPKSHNNNLLALPSPSTHSLIKMTSHKSKSRIYETQTTFSCIPKIKQGPSPLDMFMHDTNQGHERIAVGLKRVVVEKRERVVRRKASCGEFEWMRQFRLEGRWRGDVEVFHSEGDEEED